MPKPPWVFNYTELPDTLLELFLFFNFKNLEKGHVRDGLSFSLLWADSKEQYGCTLSITLKQIKMHLQLAPEMQAYCICRLDIPF